MYIYAHVLKWFRRYPAVAVHSDLSAIQAVTRCTPLKMSATQLGSIHPFGFRHTRCSSSSLNIHHETSSKRMMLIIVLSVSILCREVFHIRKSKFQWFFCSFLSRSHQWTLRESNWRGVHVHESAFSSLPKSPSNLYLVAAASTRDALAGSYNLSVPTLHASECPTPDW